MAEQARKDTMKISELSRAADVPVSTIKFYLSRGLLPAAEKPKPNVAYYDQAFLRRLLVIKRMRSEGLTVRSIKSIIDKYTFDRVSEWESFRTTARSKSTSEAGPEERMATLKRDELRRQDILDAAFRVFAQKGYYSTTIDDIAEEAAISRGTCYQYFSGKEEMFIEIAVGQLDRMIEEAKKAAAGVSDPLTSLGIKALAFLSKYESAHLIILGLFSEARLGNETLRQTALATINKVSSFMMDDIDRGIELGVFRPLDRETVADALMGMAVMAGNRYLIDKDFDLQQFFANLLEFLQHGLLKNDSEKPGE